MKIFVYIIPLLPKEQNKIRIRVLFIMKPQCGSVLDKTKHVHVSHTQPIISKWVEGDPLCIICFLLTAFSFSLLILVLELLWSMLCWFDGNLFRNVSIPKNFDFYVLTYLSISDYALYGVLCRDLLKERFTGYPRGDVRNTRGSCCIQFCRCECCTVGE